MERQQRVLWNAPEQSYPCDTCVQQAVEEQAARTPEALAVVAGSQALSYQALNQQANQLAHYCRSWALGRSRRWASVWSALLELVVGLLGILKAGGAYVPLDPLSA